MSEFRETKRIVVDPSMLEGLFGPPDTEPVPERPARPIVTPASRSDAPTADEPPATELPEPPARSPGKATTIPGDLVEVPRAAVAERQPDAGQAVPVIRGPRAVPQLEATGSGSNSPVGDPLAVATVSVVLSEESVGHADDPAWFHRRANQWFAAGEYWKAADSYREVIRRDERCWSGHYNLGLSQMRMGDHGDAVDALRRALELAPGKVEVRYALGLCQLHLGASLEALREFERVLEKEPEHDRARFGKGVAAHQMRRFADAKDCYKALLKEHPDDTELVANLATA